MRYAEILPDGRVLSLAGWDRTEGSHEFRLWSTEGKLMHWVGKRARQPHFFAVPEHARWMVLRSDGMHVEIWALPPKGQPGNLR